MKLYNGACVCGTINFTVLGEPLFTQYCHCNKCRDVAADSQRKQDKIGYSFTAAYIREKFTILSDSNNFDIVEKENSKLYRCNTCKSLIYGISNDPNKQAGIGLNINNFVFDHGLPDAFKPDKHIWYADRIIDIDDQLPKYRDAPVEQFGSGLLW